MNNIKTWRERRDGEDGMQHAGYKLYGERFYMLEEIAELRAVLAAAAPSPAVAPEPVTWRVAEFWSSANPGKKVLMLAEGEQQISDWGARGDFIRWCSPAATPPSLAVRDIPREPTSEMMEAANRQREVGGDTKDCWRAMWDAAMREQS